ncbi:hypothetical protein CXIVA_01580 [Clostridium sp. SY8519]|uniref:hypothetical protein n=1 Tax=Clostridium sp. (strain SY8519) TaxID=1042156 RepID=UPI000217154C|nr:hypothetical protein [Clostridium sp. SY8519]BAK46125.1 hypothetical protein CXIVA_01580 [Clostridium sp. SY8519]
MHEPIVFTPEQVYQVILAVAGLIISCAGAIGIIAKVVRWFRKPADTQKERVDAHERRLNGHDESLKEIRQYLDRDKHRLDKLEEGNRIVQQSLLAIMAHLLNNNDIDELKKAKESLEQYLIEK